MQISQSFAKGQRRWALTTKTGGVYEKLSGQAEVNKRRKKKRSGDVVGFCAGDEWCPGDYVLW